MVEKIFKLIVDKLSFIFSFLWDAYDGILTVICNFIKIDKNTFMTIVLTAISIYLCADRVFEVLIIIFTGVGVSYWNPIMIVIAVVIPFVAYLYAIDSSFIEYTFKKISAFYFYGTLFSIIAVASTISFLNGVIWTLIFSAPSYSVILVEDKGLIIRALSAIAIWIIAMVAYRIYIWFAYFVASNQDILDSLCETPGIKSSSSGGVKGPYSFEMPFGIDSLTGDKVVMSQAGRFRQTLVVGHVGMGKTESIFENMIARDIKKKRFFIDQAKEIGFNLLKSNKAQLKSTYSNEFLNNNFNFEYLKPKQGEEYQFIKATSKILSGSRQKNYSVIYVTEDMNSINKMEKVCNNFKIGYKKIDPLDPDTYGINPFANQNTKNIPQIISKVLHTFEVDNLHSTQLSEISFQEINAIENLSELLIKTYPVYNQGQLPTLEDMLKLINNFRLLTDLVNKQKENSAFMQKNHALIEYFDNNALNQEEKWKELLAPLASLIEVVLRDNKIKRLLCNRTNNIDFVQVAKNGEVVLVNRQCGEVSNISHINAKAFGKIVFDFICTAGLGDEAQENQNLPMFVYYDDFVDYLNPQSLKLIGELTKKQVAFTISIDTLAGVSEQVNPISLTTTFGNKFVFGDAWKDEMDFWVKDFGVAKNWIGIDKNFDDSSEEKILQVTDTGKYDFAPIVSSGRMSGGKPNAPAFKVLTNNGKMVGYIKLSKVPKDFLEGFKDKQYNFEDMTFEEEIKYTGGTMKKLMGVENIKNTFSGSNNSTKTKKDNKGQKSNGSSPIKYL